MGKLAGRSVGPRLSGHAAPALARRDIERGVDRKRNDTLPWRKLYVTTRWRKLRARILARDGFQCRQTGVLLTGKHPAPNSPVVDHIVPAHEFWPEMGEAMFWDESNLQSVSKAWHDSEKQRAEVRTSGGVG